MGRTVGLNDGVVGETGDALERVDVLREDGAQHALVLQQLEEVVRLCRRKVARVLRMPCRVSARLVARAEGEDRGLTSSFESVKKASGCCLK